VEGIGTTVSVIVSNGLEQGFIYAFMVLGVYLSFRLLGFPDLTVEGTFPFGAAVSAALLVNGWSPALALAVAVLAGMVAGIVAGVIHTKLKINNILAGILTASALYTVMFWVMGRPNQPLLEFSSVLEQIQRVLRLPPGIWPRIFLLGLLAIGARLLLGWFLNTDLGLAIRATGNNEGMIRSLGVNTDTTKIVTLAISNGAVALSGALVAQIQGFADVSMGIGVLVAAVASVILGETIFGTHVLGRLLTGVVVGSIIYRALLTSIYLLGIPPTNFKLITAAIVLVALGLPTLWTRWRSQVTRARRRGAQARLHRTE
jgi:putative ABC transport system permease protein